MPRCFYASLLLACALLCGCATNPGTKRDPRDPFERVNRATFKFNDAIDRAAIKPIAQEYRKVAPHFVQTGIANFTDNLSYPVTLVNDLLQAKFKATLNDTARLLLNTIVGLGGFLDPASRAGLDKNDEDFGQTLGRWHVGSGPYLMLPILGPSTIRDGIGLFADEYAEPRSYIQDPYVRWGLRGVSGLVTRTRLLDTEAAMGQVYDRYAFIRNAYLQHRQYLVTDGRESSDSLSESEEEKMLEESQ